MDVCSVIKARLGELKVEQKDLAAAAEVTESYVSQLLTGKKLPPAPDRTDIYGKIEAFLDLKNGSLETLARTQRMEALKRGFEEPPAPLFEEVRELVLSKCTGDRKQRLRAVFEKQSFGEIERLVTQKLLEVAKRAAQEELENETWLHEVARLNGKTYEQMRVTILEFLDTDVFSISDDNCVAFLNPLIKSWDIDLSTFGIEIVLNQRLVHGRPVRFELLETDTDLPTDQPGLTAFLEDRALGGNVMPEEIEFLKRLRIDGRRPNPLYYYRELQNLRDPLHFEPLELPSKQQDAASRKP